MSNRMKPLTEIESDLFETDVHCRKITTLDDSLLETESSIGYTALATQVDRVASALLVRKVDVRPFRPRRSADNGAQ